MVWPKGEWLWLSPAPTAPGESGLSHVTESLQPTKLNVILAPVWQAAASGTMRSPQIAGGVGFSRGLLTLSGATISPGGPQQPVWRERPKDKIKMKSLLVRRKHVNLNEALTAMSDPTIPRRDAVIMWRKALRRANAPTKELIRVAKLHPRKP